VVLHVTPPNVRLGIVVLEAGEDLSNIHLHDVDHHVEPPPVRHPDYDLLDAELRGPLREDIQHRDHAFGAFQGESLGPCVLGMEELLEDLRVGELGQDANLLLAAEVDVIARKLHPLPEPIARLSVLEGRELDADRSCVGVFESLEHGPQRLGGRSRQVARREDCVWLDVGESVALQNELVFGRALLQSEWV